VCVRCCVCVCGFVCVSCLCACVCIHNSKEQLWLLTSWHRHSLFSPGAFSGRMSCNSPPNTMSHRPGWADGHTVCIMRPGPARSVPTQHTLASGFASSYRNTDDGLQSRKEHQREWTVSYSGRRGDSLQRNDRERDLLLGISLL